MKSFRRVLLASAVVAVCLSGGTILQAVDADQQKQRSKRSIAAARASAPNRLREFRVTARDGDITPSKLKVRKGDRVRITFVSKDSTYGLKIKKYGIKRKVKEGQPVTVEFDATERGEFPLRCSKVWGFKRWKKNGLILVR